jgi:hypothetical protein
MCFNKNLLSVKSGNSCNEKSLFQDSIASHKVKEIFYLVSTWPSDLECSKLSKEQNLSRVQAVLVVDVSGKQE